MEEFVISIIYSDGYKTKKKIIGGVVRLFASHGETASVGQFKCRFAREKATERRDGGASAALFALIQKSGRRQGRG